MFKKLLVVAVFAFTASCVAQAADFSKVPDATKNMKVGQWVQYKIQGGMEMKQTVASIEGEGDDRVITLKMEMSMGGQVMGSQDQVIRLSETKAQEKAAREANPDVEITEEQITVNGKTFDAVVLTAKIDGSESKTYMSEEVPVTGLIKMDITGIGTTMELVDFGE